MQNGKRKTKRGSKYSQADLQNAVEWKWNDQIKDKFWGIIIGYHEANAWKLSIWKGSNWCRSNFFKRSTRKARKKETDRRENYLLLIQKLEKQLKERKVLVAQV